MQEGVITNQVMLHIVNKSSQSRAFSVRYLPTDAKVTLPREHFELDASASFQLPIIVRFSARRISSMLPITFVVTEDKTQEQREISLRLIGPEAK